MSAMVSTAWVTVGDNWVLWWHCLKEYLGA